MLSVKYKPNNNNPNYRNTLEKILFRTLVKADDYLYNKFLCSDFVYFFVW